MTRPSLPARLVETLTYPLVLASSIWLCLRAMALGVAPATAVAVLTVGYGLLAFALQRKRTMSGHEGGVPWL